MAEDILCIRPKQYGFCKYLGGATKDHFMRPMPHIQKKMQDKSMQFDELLLHEHMFV